MSDNRFMPTRQPRPSYLSQQGGGSSNGAASASTSTAGASSSRLAAPTSRFGFRAPSAGGGAAPSSSSSSSAGPAAAAVMATPLGKRTASNTSLPDGGPPSSAKRPSSSSQTPLRASRPPSPTSSQHLSAIKSQYESRLLLSQQSYDGLEASYRTLASEVERLKSERRELAEEWARVKEERASEQKAWQEEREKLRSTVKEERGMRSEVEEELQGVVEEAARQRQEAHSEVRELRVGLGRVEAERDGLREQVRLDEENKARDTQRLSQEEAKVQELEAKVADLESKAATASSTATSDASVERELHRILTHSRQLEVQISTLTSTNSSLRKQAEGTAVLREENTLLRNKVDSLSSLQSRVVELEEQHERRVAEDQAWDDFLAQPETFASKIEAEAAMAAGDVDADVPKMPAAPQPLQRSTLPAYLCQLRGLVSGLLTRSQILASKVSSSRQRQADLEDELQAREEEVRQCKRREEEAKDRIEELQRVKAQWEEENRRYRGLLKSYEEQEKRDEATAAASTSVAAIKRDVDHDGDQEMGNDDDQAPPASSAHLERISLLETELDLKRTELTTLSSTHESATQQLKASHLAAQQEIESLRADVVALQRENERLDAQLGKAEERLGLGEFDQNKYRCLVLKRNPVDVDRDLRTKTMDRIKGENEELVKRVEELSKKLQEQAPTAAVAADASNNGDDPASSTAGLVPASTVANLRADIAHLTTQLALKDKTLLRLKQVYTSKSSEFRSAIQSLFGFKVRFLENGSVRLNSTFARSTSRATSLVFASEGGDVGRMKLTGEAARDLSLANVPHLREYWLAGGGKGGRESVPCFLAALQLELYESTTQAVRGAWAVPDAEEDEE